MGDVIKFPEHTRELTLYQRPERDEDEVFAYTATQAGEVTGIVCTDNAMTIKVMPCGKYAVFNSDDDMVGGFLFDDLGRLQAYLFAFLAMTGYFGQDVLGKLEDKDGADSEAEES